MRWNSSTSGATEVENSLLGFLDRELDGVSRRFRGAAAIRGVESREAYSTAASDGGVPSLRGEVESGG